MNVNRFLNGTNSTYTFTFAIYKSNLKCVPSDLIDLTNQQTQKKPNEQNKLIISHKPRLILYKKKLLTTLASIKLFIKTLYAETTHGGCMKKKEHSNRIYVYTLRDN